MTDIKVTYSFECGVSDSVGMYDFRKLRDIIEDILSMTGPSIHWTSEVEFDYEVVENESP